ncbi:uncharacterized protein V1516DRAFT_679954 [Lipomyces oligophaga]|uniref:uncharacterized protein n=1 Tax=Lipomyces oligophaga TaxID=45792 RepID=UPI0034CFCCED
MVYFMCYMVDKQGAISARVSARPAHLARAKQFIEQGVFPFGGAVLTQQPGTQLPDGNPPIIGSVIVVDAESKEKVLEILENDPYKDVWDFNRSQINYFVPAIPMK